MFKIIILKNKRKNEEGFTIPELLISIFIISILSITATTFSRDIFLLNSNFSGGMNAQLEARHVVKIIISELRETSPSNLGAYPIALASSSAITFYSDIDNNGLKDKVRYFLNGNDLKRGVIAPSGSPLTYVTANEKITTLATNVVSSSTLPIFQYYPSNYSGTSTPLAQPVNLSSVRLVKVNVIIDKNPNHSPVPIIVTSQVSLRNLKDNF